PLAAHAVAAAADGERVAVGGRKRSGLGVGREDAAAVAGRERDVDGHGLCEGDQPEVGGSALIYHRRANREHTARGGASDAAGHRRRERDLIGSAAVGATTNALTATPITSRTNALNVR